MVTKLRLVPVQKTSLEAYDRIKAYAPTQRERVFDVINQPSGATCDEVMAALNLNNNSANPRIIELREEGRIVDSGLTRLTRSGRKAIVWIVVKQPMSAQLRRVA